jgi:hypothetical protein
MKCVDEEWIVDSVRVVVCHVVDTIESMTPSLA